MSKNNIIYIAVAIVLVVTVGIVVVGMSTNKSDSSSKSSSSMMSSDSSKMEEKTVTVGGAAMYPSKNIVENVSNAKNLTTLVAAVKAGGLLETLSGPGPFTVFGPNNDAFNALPAGTLDTVLKPENLTALQTILKYHVVSGKYLIADLKDGQELTTVQGQVLKITKKDNTVMVNDAVIETQDVLQSNGVAHVINKVLMPDTNPTVGGMAMYKTKNLVENVVAAPNLSTLVAALKAADLVDALKTPGPITAFGPDNDAFAKLPKETLSSLLLPENKAKLQAVLQYHVVAGKYLTSDLKDGQELTTLSGKKLTIMKSGGKVMIKSNTSGNIATIVTADVVQSNGVAHVIDTVLIPS